MRQHDSVEFVTMQDQQLAPVCGGVDRLAPDFDAAEIESGELAEHLVVVAGDIDHPRAALGALEDAPENVVMARGPVKFLFESPAIDNVADQIERIAVDMVEKVDQHFDIAAARAEMHVADPDRAVARTRSAFTFVGRRPGLRYPRRLVGNRRHGVPR